MMKLLASLHRWLGIALGLFFAMWFFTGIVMMYVPFPSISASERLGYLPDIDISRITVPPREAIAICESSGTLAGLRLISIQRRPVYVCSGSPREQAVFADVAGRVQPLSSDTVTASVRTLVKDSFDLIGGIEYDQWTVHQRFDPLRPFYRAEVQDELGTHIYVSARTGEIVQRTTRSQRFWNYLGAVAHWIYPTVLRKHWAIWDALVWWLSAFAILGATIGIYLGVSHWLRRRRSERSGVSPFRGWMKWHHVLGLLAGIVVISWIVSGWLSMDHGRLFSKPNPTQEQVRAVQGVSLAEASSRVGVEELARYHSAREIVFHAFGGNAVVVARNHTGVVHTDTLEQAYVARTIDTAFPDVSVARHSVVAGGDTYTDLREGRLPQETLRIELTDSGDSWLHINAYSGEIISVMDRSRRVYRWLFNGLHSLDFPGLVDKRPLWDAVMLLLLVAGLCASLSGVVVGWKRLRSMVRR